MHKFLKPNDCFGFNVAERKKKKKGSAKKCDVLNVLSACDQSYKNRILKIYTKQTKALSVS